MKWIKTVEQARQYGISYQHWVSNKNLSYEELAIFQGRLETLAEKFDLIEEFKENGLI